MQEGSDHFSMLKLINIVFVPPAYQMIRFLGLFGQIEYLSTLAGKINMDSSMVFSWTYRKNHGGFGWFKIGPSQAAVFNGKGIKGGFLG